MTDEPIVGVALRAALVQPGGSRTRSNVLLPLLEVVTGLVLLFACALAILAVGATLLAAAVAAWRIVCS